MIDSVYIHIGTEKTGTTTIQKYLSSNRKELLKQNVLFPRCLGNDNQITLAAYAQNSGKLDDVRRIVLQKENKSLDDFRRSLKSRLRTEVNKSDACTLVVSNEHCHSRLKSLPEIERLKSLFNEYSECIKIIIYIRRQDRVATSLFSTAIKCGRTSLSSIFPKIQRSELPYYYNYRQILLQYEKIFGKNNIEVRVYDDVVKKENGLIEDFSKCLGINTESLVIPERENVSLSFDTQVYLAEFNRYIPWFVNGTINPKRGNIVELLESMSSGRGYLPSKNDAKGFYNNFLWINNWVAENYFPEKDQLFDLDFTEYPDECMSATPSYKKMIEISSKIWEILH